MRARRQHLTACLALLSLGGCHSPLEVEVRGHCEAPQTGLEVALATDRRDGGASPFVLGVGDLDDRFVGVQLFQEFAFCAHTRSTDTTALVDEFQALAARYGELPASRPATLGRMRELFRQVNALPLKR